MARPGEGSVRDSAKIISAATLRRAMRFVPGGTFTEPPFPPRSQRESLFVHRFTLPRWSTATPGDGHTQQNFVIGAPELSNVWAAEDQPRLPQSASLVPRHTAPRIVGPHRSPW